MIRDPEERRRQREEQARQRRQQAAQQRKTLIRLGIAGIVLAAVGILILVITLAGRSDPSGESTPTESLRPDQSQTEPTEQTGQTDAMGETVPLETLPPTTTIRFTAAGDLNINDAVVASAQDGQYTDAFLDVAHLLADADLTTLNLEGSLTGAPYGSSTASAPQSLAQALDRAGVDLIQLANSYAINQGISGLRTTIESVRSAGMEPVGVYADSDDYRRGKGYMIREVQGIRVGIVAFTKGMDGMALPPGSEHCVNVLYSDYSSNYQTVDKAGISAVLDALNEQKPDITIALLHWGSEFNDTISDSQQTIVSLLQEKGVDAIVGTHSHYVQKMEYNAEKGTFIAYSLGDFFSDAQRAGTEYSILLHLEITKDNVTGVTTITDYDYTPIFTVAQEDEPLRVVRIREAMTAFESGYIDKVSQQTYDAMAYAMKRIEARINGK